MVMKLRFDLSSKDFQYYVLEIKDDPASFFINAEERKIGTNIIFIDSIYYFSGVKIK